MISDKLLEVDGIHCVNKKVTFKSGGESHDVKIYVNVADRVARISLEGPRIHESKSIDPADPEFDSKLIAEATSLCNIVRRLQDLHQDLCGMGLKPTLVPVALSAEK
jgi:hypothetical protein